MWWCSGMLIWIRSQWRSTKTVNLSTATSPNKIINLLKGIYWHLISVYSLTSHQPWNIFYWLNCHVQYHIHNFKMIFLKCHGSIVVIRDNNCKIWVKNGKILANTAFCPRSCTHALYILRLFPPSNVSWAWVKSKDSQTWLFFWSISCVIRWLFLSA